MESAPRCASWLKTVSVLFAGWLLAIGVLPAAADVQPGERISVENVDRAKDLLSPAMEWCVRHGWPLTIVETKPIVWPKAYTEATEKYSAQVQLAPDGLSLKNYVAGLPFLNIDVNDPQVAHKIMWNYEYKFLTTDDVDLRNFDADTGSISMIQAMSVERHFLLDHFRRMFYNGRLYVDPKPLYEPNPNKYRVQQGLYPILEPFDLKGVGSVGNRYLDPSKQDDQWLYLPSLRRVRRLSTAQRSDALFGQDTDVDSYYGYSGHIAWMEWSFLGERELLGAYQGQHFPVKWAEAPADWAFDDVWEKRKVYVVEGISKLPQYAYSKRVLFIDKESWTMPYSDIYDQAGELWKIWINDFSFRTSALGEGSIQYEDKMGFIPAIVMVDLQLEHATKAALPSHRYAGEQGWYFNQGEKEGVEPDWFTVAALVEAGS